MAKLLGLTVITDHQPLEDLLSGPMAAADADRVARLVDRLFPGLCAAIVASMKQLDVHRLRADRVLYFNFRVQVLAQEGFDADPTPPVRVVPAGHSMDPNGPVSFAS